MEKYKSNWKSLLETPSSCLLNIQDSLYLASEQGIQEVQGIEGIESYLFYFTDFSGFFDMGTLDVQGDYKYASLLVRKRLEDEGKLEDEDRLLIYAKHRQEKGITRVSYGIVPAERYNSLQKIYEQHPYGLIYFDPGTVLLGLVSKMDQSTDHAVALYSNNAIVVIYGRKNRIVQFKSYHLRDNTLNSLQEGLGFVEDDIRMLNWQGCSIDRLVLLECLNQQALNTEELDTEIEQSYRKEYLIKGKRIYSSLPELLPALPLHFALAPGEEKVYRSLEKGRKWLLVLLLFFILCGGVMAGKSTSDFFQLQKQVSDTERKVAALQEQLSNQIKQVEFEHAKEMRGMQKVAGNVLAISKTPALVSVWNGIAESKGEKINLDRLEIKDHKNSFRIHIEGTIESAPFSAQESYSGLILNMKKRGFKIMNKEFVSKMQNSFTLSMEYNENRANVM